MQEQADEEMRAPLAALATADTGTQPLTSTSQPPAAATQPPAPTTRRRHRPSRRHRPAPPPSTRRRRRHPDRLTGPSTRPSVRRQASAVGGGVLAAKPVEHVRVADLGVAEPHGRQQGPRHLDELGEVSLAKL